MFSRERNPPNRFVATHVEWDGQPPLARLELIDDDTKGILAHNTSPDLGFSWSVNPYRGCSHGCAYCYARAFHEYLGLGAGTDFDRRILVKRAAPGLLRAALMKPSWRGELIAFSGATDCYQPIERRLELTRRCLAVCAEFRQPVQIITRSPLIVRDLDLLQQLVAHDAVRVSISLPIPDPVRCRAVEPGAPPPAARLRAMRALADAGVPVAVGVAPVIPGLNDDLVVSALRSAAEHGATAAWMTSVRLDPSVAAVFESRLRQALPRRADRVLAATRRSRGGALSDPRPGHRMGATGAAAGATQALFELWRRKLGLAPTPWMTGRDGASPFRRPGQGDQLNLF